MPIMQRGIYSERGNSQLRNKKWVYNGRRGSGGGEFLLGAACKWLDDLLIGRERIKVFLGRVSSTPNNFQFASCWTCRPPHVLRQRRRRRLCHSYLRQHRVQTKEGDKVAKYALGCLKESRVWGNERRGVGSSAARGRANFITDPFDGIEGDRDVPRVFRGTVRGLLSNTRFCFNHSRHGDCVFQRSPMKLPTNYGRSKAWKSSQGCKNLIPEKQTKGTMIRTLSAGKCGDGFVFHNEVGLETADCSLSRTLELELWLGVHTQ